MTKTKIVLAVLTTVALFAQPVQAGFSVTRSSSVRVSSPARPIPASPKPPQAVPAKPVQQVQVAPQTPASAQIAKQTPTNTERVIIRESSGNSAVANAAIGAAAGIGTVLIADALLNDNKQPAQPTQQVVTQQLPVQQDAQPIVAPHLAQPVVEAEPESSSILIWLLLSAIVGGGIFKLVDTFRSRY